MSISLLTMVWNDNIFAVTMGGSYWLEVLTSSSIGGLKAVVHCSANYNTQAIC